MTAKESTYRNKRNFSSTPEPGTSGENPFPGKEPGFVIQRHDASSEHYDFRLEIDGTLKSWAVPKGPSTDPGEKRLAIPTEDHPLEYGSFEGVIPEGHYGAGTVMIWDRGSYDNIKKTENDEPVPMGECYENGQIEVFLHGDKIAGGYALVKAGKQMDGNWLLIKMDDEQADARRNPVSTEPDSAATGRSMDQIRKDAASETES